MTVVELVDLFTSKITDILVANSIDLPVVQLNQPTQQARNITGAIYFTFIIVHRHGMPQISKIYNEDTGVFDSISTQNMESKIQFSVLKPLSPNSGDYVTPTDIANLISMGISSPKNIKSLAAVNVNIFRITDIRNPYFINDREQFESMPNFDISFIHNLTYNETVPIVASIEGVAIPVPSIGALESEQKTIAIFNDFNVVIPRNHNGN